jgi:prepilin peptidase dependent protein B
MLVKNTLKLRHTHIGVSLIELMISITLGVLLMLAATAMTTSSMVMNADTLKSARLNQDLDSVLQVMVNDIRRAGYSGAVPDFFEGKESLYIKDDNSCVLYAYDTIEDGGALEAADMLGFKLDNGAIFMRTSCNNEDNVDCATNCSVDPDGWVALTDVNVIDISTPEGTPGLTFDSGNSKCLNIKNDPAKDNHFWVKTEDDAGNPSWRFPCADHTDEKLTNYVIQPDGSWVDLGTIEVLKEDDRLIEVRQVNITLQGELKNDDTMVKSQFVAINVRNNRVCKYSETSPHCIDPTL